MFAAFALLLVQAQAPQGRDAELGIHQLVKELPRFGDAFWDSSPEKEPPLSIRAQNSLRERMRNGAVLDLDDWNVILIDKGYLRWRARWPVDHAFAVGLHIPDLSEGLGIELTPALAGGTPARAFRRSRVTGCCSGGGDGPLLDDWQTLGWLDRAQHQLSLELRVIGSTQPLGVLNLRVEPVTGIGEAILPTTDPVRGAALAGCLRIDDADFSARLFVGDWEQPDWLACSLDIELLHGREIVEVTQSPLRGWPHESLALKHLPRAVARGEEPAKGWSLRVRGTSKNVLRDWNATQYWAGEIEVPLADLIRR